MPAAWGIEVVFFDESRPSAMHGGCRVTLDGKRVTVELENGEIIAYDFKDVKRVLSMHSTKFDYAANEAATD